MSKLLLDEYPLIILPKLAVLVGLNEAIVLQQLNYWLQKSAHIFDGRRWIYNTYEQWQEQFPFWSISTIRRALTVLRKPYFPSNRNDTRAKREALVLVGRFNKAGFDKTNWWAVVYSEVERLGGMIRRSVQVEQTMRSKRPDGLFKLNRPIPETTQRLPETSERGTDHLSLTLPSGLHKGKTLEQVQEADPGYLKWVARHWRTNAIREAAGRLVGDVDDGRWTETELATARSESLAETPIDVDEFFKEKVR